MPSTTSYNQGDVVLVRFPFTDLTSTKKRPALVVSPDWINRLRGDYIVAQITTVAPARLQRTHILLTGNDQTSSGLLKPSVLVLSKLATLHSSIIDRRLGSVPEHKLEEALTQLQSIFS